MRYYIVSERYGLVAVTDEAERAEDIALRAAVNTARTVYLHDRLNEYLNQPERPPADHTT